MTEKVKKKRDELAEEYCVRPLPEALKKDLIRYKPDNLKIIQRLEYAAYKHGFDAGYQMAMDEANERIQKLREALEFYANAKNWECDETYNITKIIDDESIWHYSNVNGDYDHIGGKTARAALKEDNSKSI